MPLAAKGLVGQKINVAFLKNLPYYLKLLTMLLYKVRLFQ
jgi:hypothetical protein